jgi:hypothetical protein
MQQDDNEPVLVVTNKQHKLVHAGHPDTFKKKLLGEYAKEGHKINTITIKQFRAKEWRWYWED